MKLSIMLVCCFLAYFSIMVISYFTCQKLDKKYGYYAGGWSLCIVVTIVSLAYGYIGCKIIKLLGL